MINRDVRGPLFEVPHRVASRLHDFLDQAVGVGDGRLRIIHETRLSGGPLPAESLSLLGRERLQCQLLDTLLARLQLLLGLAPVADLSDGPVVLGTEPAAEAVSSSLLNDDPGHDRERDDGQRDDHDQYGSLTHGSPPKEFPTLDVVQISFREQVGGRGADRMAACRALPIPSPSSAPARPVSRVRSSLENAAWPPLATTKGSCSIPCTTFRKRCAGSQPAISWTSREF